MQNTIQLPDDLYEAIRKKAAAQKKSTDDLVIEWVYEHLNASEASEMNRVFEQEIAAFENLKPTLVEKFLGQFVAIYKGEVVASGLEKLDLIKEVREKYGDFVFYVEMVSPDSPRIVRIPSTHIVRSGSPTTLTLIRQLSYCP